MQDSDAKLWNRAHAFFGFTQFNAAPKPNAKGLIRYELTKHEYLGPKTENDWDSYHNRTWHDRIPTSQPEFVKEAFFDYLMEEEVIKEPPAESVITIKDNKLVGSELKKSRYGYNYFQGDRDWVWIHLQLIMYLPLKKGPICPDKALMRKIDDAVRFGITRNNIPQHLLPGQSNCWYYDLINKGQAVYTMNSTKYELGEEVIPTSLSNKPSNKHRYYFITGYKKQGTDGLFYTSYRLMRDDGKMVSYDSIKKVN